MSRYFIVGTGTDVGKTFTTCALIHAARAAGQTAQGFKPIISGWDDSPATDTAQIIMAGGNTQTVEEVSPWRLSAPLSPHLAAIRENRAIALEDVVAWSARTMEQAKGLTLLEGVGGVCVPLNHQHTTLDWIAAQQLPVILVTGSYLGSISHTLTALMALQAATAQVKALVVNETQGSTVTLAETEEGLTPFINTIKLRIFQPRVSSYQQAEYLHALVDKL